MRDVMRLSLTLALVAVISALLLTGVHSVTDPVIRERRERDYLMALERFFPEIDQFETEEIDRDRFDLVYDEAGNKLGVMASVKTQGYDGEINYNLAVDAEGNIIGILIISHSETPGIGDVITTENFQEQFIGKSFYDPLQAGNDVDAVSGATISSGAMINSIRRTITMVGENFLGKERQAFGISGIADGVYRGSVDGTYGVLTVEVKVAGGRIENIEVVEQNETEAYFIEVYPELPDKIIEEQSLEIDVQTGATLSAERLLAAVQIALENAPDREQGGGDANEGG